MLLSDVESAVRLDLFDPVGGNMRWTNADLDRAIDRAVVRYSEYCPNVFYADMPAQAGQRTYPFPVSWNPAYPVWWIERVLYPLQVARSALAAPEAGMGASAVAGSGLGVGTYRYAVTFLSQGGETTPSPIVSVTTTGGNQQIVVSAIPTGPATTGGWQGVIGRVLYRSQVGGTTLYLLAVLDNNATSYIDVIADSLLVGMPSPPVVNTSGVMYWPPRERELSEYSNLYVGSLSLASSGNLGVMGAAGPAAGPTGTQEPTFTLLLSDDELPVDSTEILRVFYATRHQLDALGSTIPDAHRDIITLGACAYCLEAYQVPTNDNFAFQDGTLHDRIDDTRIPAAWARIAIAKMQQFHERLEEIKYARTYASSARVRWRL
jgi:hypothetical protein